MTAPTEAGALVWVKHDNRTLPGRVEQAGPESYEVTVLVEYAGGREERLVVHRYNVEPRAMAAWRRTRAALVAYDEETARLDVQLRRSGSRPR